MTRSRIAVAFPLLLALLGFILGCGGGDNLKNVTGVVTMDEKPLAEAFVSFTPVQGGRPAVGRTNEAGEYELVFTRSAEGAKPGEYVVRISTYDETADENDETVVVAETVPVQYNLATDLNATVTEEGPNVFNFDLISEGEKFQPED